MEQIAIRKNELYKSRKRIDSERTDCVIRGTELQSERKHCQIGGNELLIVQLDVTI